MNSFEFNHREVLAYEDSLKSYRDLKNSLDTAFAEGVEEGIEQGIQQMAINGIRHGLNNVVLIKLTKLSEEQIEYLRDKYKD